MKNLLFVLVALTPTPSSAREAILDVFSPEAKPDFAVLAPQLRAAADLEQSVEPPPAENGGAIFDHGSGGIVLLRAA